MAASPLLRKARKVVPITALAIALVTLFGCVLIAKAKGVYLSGMFWPFFSNTGRDKPAYYLFCAGLTTTAVLVAVTYGFNYQYQIAALRNAVGENTRKHQGMAMGTLAAGVLSVFGLSLLAFFDTAKYPSTHSISAYWFFGWEVVATIMNTFVSKRIFELSRKSDAAFTAHYITLADTNGKPPRGERAQKCHRTFRVQLAFNLVFFVAFVIYIPWQVVFPTRCPMLSINECVTRGYGQEYCSVTMRKNATETILQNCEQMLTKVQIRALAQLVCILTLIGYCVTFYVHDYDDAEQDDLLEQAPPFLHPL